MARTAGVKNGFVAGLLLVAPLVVTVFVLRVLVTWSLRVIDPLVRGTRLARFTANNEIAAQVLAAVLILAGITALGYLATWSVGRHVFGNVGRVVNVVPLANTIYGSVRQVANALVDRDSGYDRVALVEHPREGIYSVGLVTGESPGAVGDRLGERTATIFLPNSPNPTGGRLILVPEDQIYEIDLSVREAMRLVVTTGLGFEAAETGAGSAAGIPTRTGGRVDEPEGPSR